MIRSVVLALMMVIALSAESFGQNRGGQKNEDPGPIGTLLLWRAQLGLSEAQITRLTEIEAEVDRQNLLPLEQLTEIRRQLRSMGPRHRLDAAGLARYEAHTEAMRPLAKQLETNMHAAMNQAIGQLTEAQRRQVWRLMQQQQQQNRNRGRNDNAPQLPSADN